MYLDEYKRWLAADLEDADLKPELAKVEGNDDEIKDRFAVALKFGTAGLRGVLEDVHQPYQLLDTSKNAMNIAEEPVFCGICRF